MKSREIIQQSYVIIGNYLNKKTKKSHEVLRNHKTSCEIIRNQLKSY